MSGQIGWGAGAALGKRGFLIAALWCVMAAVLGLGLSTEQYVTPRDSQGVFRQIGGDGWVENGAQILLNDLARYGNRLTLTFNPWRPSHLQPADIIVKVCGNPAAHFQVTRDNPVHRFWISGSCEPRRIDFEVTNPFVPSKRDRRQVGARLESMEVNSPAIVPVRSPATIVSVVAALFALVFLYSVVFRAVPSLRRLQWLPAFVIPLCGMLLLSHADVRSMEKLFGLWLLSAATGIGLVFAALISKESLTLGSAAPKQSSSQTGVARWWPALVGLVVLVAAGIRFWGLSFGLPNNYHPDEVPKINAIMRMVESGNLDPQYFLHPSFLLYSSYFVNSVIHWLGIPLADWVGIPGDFRSTQFLAGRIVSATAGTASVYFVYRIGQRLFSRDVGLFGALLLAVFPLHVTCSRYMKEDALLTCMLLATVVALLKAVQEDRKGWLYFAGFLAGVSAASKYSGLLAVGIVAAAPWLRSRSFRPDRSYILPTLTAMAIAPYGFVACTPYSILNSATFIKDFSSERNHMLRGHTIPIDAWSQFWMYHFWRSIIPGISMAATLAALAGVGVLIWRRRIEDLFIVGLVLMFYLPAEWVKAKPEPQPERYIFPCLPFLAIAAGEFLRILRQSSLRAVAPLAALLIVAFPLTRTLQLASEVPDDTRDRMARWMVEHLPPGSKVYLDWKPYAPRFWNNEFQVTHIPRARILEKLEVQDLKTSGQDYLVLSSLFYDRYFSQPLAQQVFQDRLKAVFQHVPIVTQISAEHGTYGFHNPSLTLFSLKPQEFARLEEELQLKRDGKLAETSNELRAQFSWEQQK